MTRRRKVIDSPSPLEGLAETVDTVTDDGTDSREITPEDGAVDYELLSEFVDTEGASGPTGPVGGTGPTGIIEPASVEVEPEDPEVATEPDAHDAHDAPEVHEVPEVATEPDAPEVYEVPASVELKPDAPEVSEVPEVATTEEEVAPKVVKKAPKAPEPVKNKRAEAAKPEKRRLRNQLKFVR